MAKPDIVLVPGAFFPTEVNDGIKSRLEAAGHACTSVTLPSVGSSAPASDFSGDVKAVRTAIADFVGKGRDCVVVMHSYGGVPGSEAVSAFRKLDRSQTGQTGGVIKLVYLASFVVPQGSSLFDATGGKPPDFWHIENDEVFAQRSESVFFNDLPIEEGLQWKARLRPQSLGSIKSKRTTTGWKGIPAVFLLCEKDNAIPPFAQEGMVQAAGEDFTLVRCDSGHMPQLSRPDFVTQLIRDAAGG